MLNRSKIQPEMLISLLALQPQFRGGKLTEMCAAPRKRNRRRLVGSLWKDKSSFVKEAPYIMLRGDLNKTHWSYAAL